MIPEVIIHATNQFTFDFRVIVISHLNNMRNDRNTTDNYNCGAVFPSVILFDFLFQTITFRNKGLETDFTQAQ